MVAEKKPVQFRVDEATKRSIREEASRRDMSMAEFSKRAVLDELEGTPVPNTAETVDDPELAPLEDFIESELVIGWDAGPVAKRELYERYVEFCSEHYPGHDPETQHKVSRQLNSQDVVDDGRAYFEREGEGLQQERCFFNVRWSDVGGVWG